MISRGARLKLDKQLLALLSQIDRDKPPGKAITQVRTILDEYTHGSERPKRAWLLYKNWAQDWQDSKTVASGHFYDPIDPRREKDVWDQLHTVFVAMVRLVNDGINAHFTKKPSQELRSELADYLSMRGHVIHTPPISRALLNDPQKKVLSMIPRKPQSITAKAIASRLWKEHNLRKSEEEVRRYISGIRKKGRTVEHERGVGYFRPAEGSAT